MSGYDVMPILRREGMTKNLFIAARVRDKCSIGKLPGQDSNLEKQDQNLL